MTDTGAATDGSAPADTGSPFDSGSTVDAGFPDSGEHPDAMIVDGGLNCDNLKTTGAGWFPPGGPIAALSGAIQLGQTHVADWGDSRHVPAPIAEREALLLFTPTTPLPSTADVRVRALDGGSVIGVLGMSAEPTPLLEQGLTQVPLTSYATDEFAANLPWTWMREGVNLEIAYLDPAGPPQVFTHVLQDLSAPHTFTITRSKIVLFGDRDKGTATRPAEKIATDFFASVPTSRLEWVDYAPWFVDEMVVTTANGPQLVQNETERSLAQDGDHHWSILKNQFTLRMSLANTGRGLVKTNMSQGDSSPYSFGTSVGMGWFRDGSGNYHDIDDAPWAAGWTGWTAMWLNECGNAFIHEVGHSFTLAHFTAGTAMNWGIAGEYPQDGTNLETHPWGYDNLRRQLRTWYRVDSSGPVMDMAGIVGKRDPMNGGEAPNAITCFPQYTGYHAEKAQGWMTSSRTIANLNGVPAVYLWDDVQHRYVIDTPQDDGLEPTAVGVPVVTLIGVLAQTATLAQTYPPLYAPSGNVFVMPDPFAAGLPAAFNGARYYVSVRYAGGGADHALIARPDITDDGLYGYSLNVDGRRTPTQVEIYRADAAYPNITTGTLLHTRMIDPAPRLVPVLSVGNGEMANERLRLGSWCEAGLNCDGRAAQSTWRIDDPIWFTTDTAAPPHECSAFDVHRALSIDVEDEMGNAATLTVHAARIVEGAGVQRAVPMDDATRWVDASDVAQSLRLWIPHGPNQNLAAGRWRTTQPFTIEVMGAHRGQVEVEIDLETFAPTVVDLAAEYVSPPMMTANSSMYFLTRDPSIGPADRVWWNDPNPGAPRLRVPVVNASTGVADTLNVRAQHQSCGNDRRDFHAGEASRNCAHNAVLWVDGADNAHLQAQQMYRTPGSAPLVIDGRRWHAPNGRAIVDTIALELTYTP